jgi:hypothetical protein
MLLLSLNVRGIGGTLKVASIRRLLALTLPEVIFFQETLVSAQKARDFFLSFRPSWAVCSVNSVGNSGGLLVAWNPSLYDLAPYLTVGGILLTGRSLLLNKEIAFLNIYGPCSNRKAFWKSVEGSGLLSIKNLIMAGDFNLLLSPDEAWGGTQVGNLDEYYNDLFSSRKLIDIKPNKPVPTWRNGRRGLEAVSRRLDRFLVSEDLLLDLGLHRSWVEFPYISDHAPVLLQLVVQPAFKAFPFKFNDQWLGEKEYTDLVFKVWTDPVFLTERGKQKRIIWKLQVLKKESRIWNYDSKKKTKEKMLEIEAGITENIKSLLEDHSDLDSEAALRALESERNGILRKEEELWRLRSRALWLSCGDKNTKYFHKIASYNRIKNHIWEIKNEAGELVSDQKSIKSEVVRYFKHLYREPTSSFIADQCKLVELFPKMINEEEAGLLYRPVSLEELKLVLSHCKKERSLGPDGWTTEFFLHFFELVGEDLLAMVEESRSLGSIVGGLNSTFLTLIPKANNPTTFEDFHPISLCNLCYKLISKIIANRIKPFLSKSISSKQMGFLKGRRIQDAIGTAHESIHSIKKKKMQALVLKLDLKKAYDCIHWDFLRLILHKIGFGLNFTNWIMSCLTSSSFVVLLNGEATDFFRSGRGVRQGCPLSPLLFILVMEGLSLLLKNSMAKGEITGIKVARVTRILHLLFVDDVLIMSKASLGEWREIDKLISFFCRASGLEVNHSKSTVYHAGLSESELIQYKSFLYFSFGDLSNGFRYLGYTLKTGAQRAVDWAWLVKKVSSRIDLWCNRWLSLGGRYILIKSVLEGQAVFWMSMEALPRSILSTLRKLMFHFLWNGQQDRKKFHLCRWEVLSRPKKFGGWGLRNLNTFNLALNTTTLWRVLTQESQWHQVIRAKYLPNSSLLSWFRKSSHTYSSASRIWLSLLRSLPIILHWITWCPGAGHSISLGRDRILGLGEGSFLSSNLLSALKLRQVTTLALAKVGRESVFTAEKWRSSVDLGLTGELASEWNGFISDLRCAGISLTNNSKDELRWTGGDGSGEITVRNAYNAIFTTKNLSFASGWMINCWKWCDQLKVTLFFWLAASNRVLTWDALMQKGWIGPSVCLLCRASTENVTHLFIQCLFTKRVWNLLAHYHPFDCAWVASPSLNAWRRGF